MVINASLVKELRGRTGAGMMDCKKALITTEGDLEAAIDLMRASGAAKAAKKASRIAAEGLVSVAISANKKRAIILEVNSETDFVTKSDDFINFNQKLVDFTLNSDINSIDDLLVADIGDSNVDKMRENLVAKIGENVAIRRLHAINITNGVIGVYKHGSTISTLVELDVDNQNLAKDIAMHIAASNPECIDEGSIAAELLEREKAVFIEQAKESGKPDNIIEKMIAGKMKKFIAEITLHGQNFVKDPDISVGKLLQNNNAKVLSFMRYKVGEGIDKKVIDFKEEVMQQAKGS